MILTPHNRRLLLYEYAKLLEHSILWDCIKISKTLRKYFTPSKFEHA